MSINFQYLNACLDDVVETVSDLQNAIRGEVSELAQEEALRIRAETELAALRKEHAETLAKLDEIRSRAIGHAIDIAFGKKYQ